MKISPDSVNRTIRLEERTDERSNSDLCMGATTSSKKSQGYWSWSGPPGHHSPFPIDHIPYPGSDLLYCFVDIMISHRILGNEVNLGPRAMTTNIEQFMDRITDCYNQGFLLTKFVRVPGIKMITQETDWTAPQPYQAILVKANFKDREKENWDLKLEKRILSTRTLPYNESDMKDDLLQTIQTYAENGARLVCAESVGYLRSETPNTQYGIMGVELFFNVPRHSVTRKYTYHTITLPATYHIVQDVTQLNQKVVCDADFLGQLKLFLNVGWKLIDICFDTNAIAEAYRCTEQYKRVETIWIFEKETANLFDETPIYEGAIIEYLHKIKMVSGKESPCCDWRPVIAGMGVSGWELASVIQTPLLVQSTFTVYTMKLLLIFQRPLCQNPSRTQLLRGRVTDFSGPGGPSGSREPVVKTCINNGAYTLDGRTSVTTRQEDRFSGSDLRGNSTMSVSPFAANRVFKYSTDTQAVIYTNQQLDYDILRTYTTYCEGTHVDQNSRFGATRYTDKGRIQTKSRSKMKFVVSSNDEEGELDEDERNSYLRDSSSLSSSADNAYCVLELRQSNTKNGEMLQIPTT